MAEPVALDIVNRSNNGQAVEEGTNSTHRMARYCKTNRWKENKNIHHEALFQDLLTSLRLSRAGDAAAVELLNEVGITELHEAVILGDYNEVERLLNNPEHVSTIDDDTEFGETALYFASYLGFTSLVLLLLKHGARVTKAESAEDSELLGAARGDQSLILDILLSKGSNIDVVCEDWTAAHVACFRKSPSSLRVLVGRGAAMSTVGDWSYSPINMLFIEFSVREKYLNQCYDEWLIKRCLDVVLRSSTVDVNYWSKCALGNPLVITRALTMLSPTIFSMLLNNGACADILFDYMHRAIHDELAVTYGIRSSKLGFGLADRIDRYVDCLRLLMNHGVEPETLDWRTTARLLLRQLKSVPLTKSQPQMELVFKMLIDCCTRPLELRSLCRRVIRRSVGHPVEARIQSIITLPPSLKSFILMADIGNGELYSA